MTKEETFQITVRQLIAEHGEEAVRRALLYLEAKYWVEEIFGLKP